MKPITYVPLDNSVKHEVLTALANSGIKVHVSEATFLDDAKVWVDDADHARALAIVSDLLRLKHVHQGPSKRKNFDIAASIRWLGRRDGLFWVAIFFVAVLIFGFAILPLWTAVRGY